MDVSNIDMSPTRNVSRKAPETKRGSVDQGQSLLSPLLHCVTKHPGCDFEILSSGFTHRKV